MRKLHIWKYAFSRIDHGPRFRILHVGRAIAVRLGPILVGIW